ncbi:MAG: FUN14 domain-containing protein [Planctomycetes bacterium]|nr:FUN14 domain-containing protein [Planctomycetota bacterium]
MTQKNQPPKPKSALAKFMFFAIVLTFVVSVLMRMLLVDTRPEQPNPLPGEVRTFTTEMTQQHPRETGALATILPYLTEASLFGVIGFALGYTSKRAFKLLLILIALSFVTIQVLVSMGKMTVDWNQMITVIDNWILNMDFKSTVPVFLKQRLPTLAVFALGYVFGLRRG